MLNQLGQFALPVSDADRSESFYGETLGLTELFRFGDLVFFDCGGVRLMLEQSSQPGVFLVLLLEAWSLGVLLMPLGQLLLPGSLLRLLPGLHGLRVNPVILLLVLVNLLLERPIL